MPEVAPVRPHKRCAISANGVRFPQPFYLSVLSSPYPRRLIPCGILMKPMRKLILLLLFLPATLHATTMKLLTLQELTDAAQVIVIAQISSDHSLWEKSHTDIGTQTQIHILN